MKVKAIANGFFGKYRRSGDEFEIENIKQFSEKWMKKLETPKAKPKAQAQAKAD